MKNSNTQQAELDNLRNEYRSTMAKAMNNSKKFFEYVKKANTILGKIHIIKKKSELKARYGKEHGLADEINIKIIE